MCLPYGTCLTLLAAASPRRVFCFLFQEGAIASPDDIPARILLGKGCPRERPTSGDQQVPGATETTNATSAERRRTASDFILRVIDKYAFPRCRDPVDISDNGGANRPLTPTAAAPLAPPAPPTSGVVLAHACVLAEALCVWKHFGLPPAALETALQPRLNERDGVRVLAAVFFPQLSRDAATTRIGPPGRDRAAQQEEVARRPGLGTAGAWARQEPKRSTSSRGALAATSASRPTPAQIDAASGLGLSPRFSLALMRTAGMNPSTSGSMGSSLYRRHPPHLEVSPRRTESDRGGSSSSSSVVGPPMRSGASPLTLLLEHRATGAEAASSLSFRPMHAHSSSSFSSSARGERGGPADVGGGWTSGPTHTGPADTDPEGTAVWQFSCGHRFTRERLLRSVVPASVSSVKQATASLQRTQQVLALEYEGWSSGAACPECAAKELVRLAAVAGASMQARNPIPVPPPLPTTPQRLHIQGTPRVR